MNVKSVIQDYFEEGDKGLRFLIYILITVGCFVRLNAYFDDKNLWADELALAQSLMTMNIWELLTQPLLYLQSSPLGFVLVAEILSNIALNEYALYLFPLASGITLIFFSYHFMKTYFDMKSSVIYLLFFIYSVSLYAYSVEFKQYMTEALVSLSFIYYYLKNKDEICSSISYKFLAILCVANLFSSTIPFTICGVMCAVIYNLGSIQNLFNYIKNGIVKICLFITFYLCYYFFYLKRTSVTGMQKYWDDTFLPLNGADFIVWFRDVFLGVMENISYIPLSFEGYRLGGVFFIIFFIYGSIRLFKTNKDLFYCVIIPLIAVLFVSACKMYPIGGEGIKGTRLMLFFFPIAFIPLTVSVVHLMQLLLKSDKLTKIFLAFSVLLVVLANIAYLTLITPKSQQTVTFISYLHENHTENAALLFSYGAEFPNNFYSRDNPLKYHPFYGTSEDIVPFTMEYLNKKDKVIFFFADYDVTHADTLVNHFRKLKYDVIRLKELGAEIVIISRLEKIKALTE